jgi:hypothetical protein
MKRALCLVAAATLGFVPLAARAEASDAAMAQLMTAADAAGIWMIAAPACGYDAQLVVKTFAGALVRLDASEAQAAHLMGEMGKSAARADQDAKAHPAQFTAAFCNKLIDAVARALVPVTP